MKKASELISLNESNEGQKSANTSTNESERLSDKWVLAIFKRFDGIYQDQWKDRHKTSELLDAAITEWAEALYGFTGEQIKTGIENCRKNLEWPPNIAQFIKQALGDNNGLSHNTAAYKEYQPALPKPKSDGKAQDEFMHKFKSQIIEARVKSSVKDSIDKFYKGDE